VTLNVEQLRIVSYPDPVLRQKATPVDPADPTVRAVALRMIELMHEAEGVGLAAPQIALSWRIFVTNARDADPVDRVYINPRLALGRDDWCTEEEGCLSLPGIHVKVRRPHWVRIEAIGLDGEPFSMEDDGFLARIWQHENDHLDGVLIIDRMTPIDRLATRKLLRDMRVSAEAGP